MSFSRRRFAVMVATSAVAGISLVGAVANSVVTIIYRDIDALWLAIALAVLGAVLTLLCVVIWLVTRVEECHDQTRKQTAAIGDNLVQRIADKVTLELYIALGNTIKEQLDAAATLGAAASRYQKLTSDSNAPISLQQWKANTAADVPGRRDARAAADSSAS